MLKIRMQRIGRKNDPAFRVVVAEHTIGAKSGKFVEKVGSHHPKTKDTTLDAERIKYWISVGAQPSDRIHNMLISEGIIEGKKRNVLSKKTPVVKEKEGEESKEGSATEMPAEAGGDEKEGGEVTEGKSPDDGEEEKPTEVGEKTEKITEESKEEASTEKTEEKSEEKDKDAEEKAEPKPAEEDEKKEV